MNVGIILVTHRQIGQHMLEIASIIFAQELENCSYYGVIEDEPPDEIFAKLQELRDSLDCSGGLVILTDLYGATPYNVARRLMQDSADATLISGINLPMVIKLFNLQYQNRSQLAESLAANGRMGILIEAEDTND